jgi:hypothetical protein
MSLERRRRAVISVCPAEPQPSPGNGAARDHMHLAPALAVRPGRQQRCKRLICLQSCSLHSFRYSALASALS